MKMSCYFGRWRSLVSRFTWAEEDEGPNPSRPIVNLVQGLGPLIVVQKMRVRVSRFTFLGVSPSGKAQDFDSCIAGSNPATPVMEKSQFPEERHET